VTLRLLCQLGLVQRLQISLTHLCSFLTAVEAEYKEQPYHNNIHASDVVQALGAMMFSDPWISALEDWEALAVVLAAAVHDVGHPGVNNDFHLRTNSVLAQEFSELGSINENFHAALAMKILGRDAGQYFVGSSQANEFSQLIRDLILSTDMKHHHEIIDDFSAALEHYGTDLKTWPPAERRHGLRMVLHCADISNPARPLKHCTEWGRRVQDELYIQGDLERKLGLNVTPACDRATMQAWHSQAVFIRRLMRPCILTLEPLAPVFVGLAMPNICASLEYWLSQADSPSMEMEQEIHISAGTIIAP